MGILLIDGDEFAQVSVKQMLKKNGFNSVSIYSVKSDQEALKIISRVKTRFRFFIRELSVGPIDSALYEAAKTDSSFDHTPFLITSSDHSKFELKKLTQTYERIDGYLQKPFATQGFLTALKNASYHRSSKRNIFILHSLREMNYSAQLQLGFQLLKVENTAKLHEITTAYHRNLGAILLDPDLYQVQKNQRDWLTDFRKTKSGSLTPVIALSRKPELPAPLRTWCNEFFDFESLSKSWENIVRIRDDIDFNNFSKPLLYQAKVYLHEKNPYSAKKCIKQVLKDDKKNPYAWNLLGDAYKLEGDFENAIVRYEKSLELNPFNPHAYVQLLQIGVTRILDNAIKYCPDHPQLKTLISK